VTLPAPNPVATRTDGQHARERLLRSALACFAARGYGGASTREIAQAAGVNISAIRYYFGDKAGLYRAAYQEPLYEGGGKRDMPDHVADDTPVYEVLLHFYRNFLAPLKQGEEVQLVLRLHFREMVEPTGLWADEIENEIKPEYQAMLTWLCRHLGLRKPDDDAQRLAFALVGAAVYWFVGREIVQGIAPQLIHTPRAIDALAERLADYGSAMVQAEARHRQSRKEPR
jgi:TetR/AcrR family transcriptional regulator, regulator of cefoperazone and chloramphenicol sensitivity